MSVHSQQQGETFREIRTEVRRSITDREKADSYMTEYWKNDSCSRVCDWCVGLLCGVVFSCGETWGRSVLWLCISRNVTINDKVSLAASFGHSYLVLFSESRFSAVLMRETHFLIRQYQRHIHRDFVPLLLTVLRNRDRQGGVCVIYLFYIYIFFFFPPNLEWVICVCQRLFLQLLSSVFTKSLQTM